MKPSDPTRPAYWASGGTILERDHTEIGDRLLASGRPLADPAARLASLQNDVAEAMAFGWDRILPEVERALADLVDAMAGAEAWARATRSAHLVSHGA